MTKIQAGRLVLYVEQGINLEEEISGVISIIQSLLDKQNKQLGQCIQFIQDLDQLPLVSCDRRRIRQVLLNLLSNAVKFTEKGTITLSAKNREKEILFAVMDTGAGIPEELQAQIFEPFIQTVDGIKHTQGTGLGLPISRNLVRAHGGDLWVESEVGYGSIFYFVLPLQASPQE
jgi:signal transduction histidine kinase